MCLRSGCQSLVRHTRTLCPGVALFTIKSDVRSLTLFPFFSLY